MSNLIVKSFLGLVFLLVFLGFLLFVSAGSLDYWQAWLYLAVFGISTLFVTLYLVKYDQKLLESRVAAETEKTQKVIQSLASLLFMLVFMVAGLDYRFHWSVVPLVISVIADIFVVLGFYIVFLTFKANSYTSAVIEVKQDQQVITSGPYAVVRHPMNMGRVCCCFLYRWR
jgi:protein-S-isoprenylcysteine O-methyltransferase Ste14